MAQPDSHPVRPRPGRTALVPNVADAQITAIAGNCDGASRAVAVRIHGVRSLQGYVMFVLYGDRPGDFLVTGKRIFKQGFPAKQGTVVFCVIVPKAGTYAAAVYHDENGNGKFDKNWIGLPVEGLGVSNNPKILLASPSHRDAVFHVQGNLTRVEIELKY